MRGNPGREIGVGAFLVIVVVVLVLVVLGIAFGSRRGSRDEGNEAAGGYYGPHGDGGRDHLGGGGGDGGWGGGGDGGGGGGGN